MSEMVLLTPAQIKSWREMLCSQIGPYALMMSDEEVQKIRDKMQQKIDNLSKKGKR